MALVYLALGSNMGDSKAYIFEAQTLLLAQLDGAVSAPLYVSKAVGYTDQADFINTVVSGHTELTPDALLVFAKQIETEIGRTKTFHWGPREIDVDIIFYDDAVSETDALTLPHPRFAERDFVLQPLCDICPDIVDPRSREPVASILSSLPANQTSILRRAG